MDEVLSLGNECCWRAGHRNLTTDVGAHRTVVCSTAFSHLYLIVKRLACAGSPRSCCCFQCRFCFRVTLASEFCARGYVVRFLLPSADGHRTFARSTPVRLLWSPAVLFSSVRKPYFLSEQQNRTRKSPPLDDRQCGAVKELGRPLLER